MLYTAIVHGVNGGKGIGLVATYDLSQAAEATGLVPNDDLETAILAPLAAGNYTAIMSGVGATTGIGLRSLSLGLDTKA